MDKTAVGQASFALMLALLDLLQEKSLLSEAENLELLQKAAQATDKLGKLSGRFGSKAAANILRDMTKNHQKQSRARR